MNLGKLFHDSERKFKKVVRANFEMASRLLNLTSVKDDTEQVLAYKGKWNRVRAQRLTDYELQTKHGSAYVDVADADSQVISITKGSANVNSLFANPWAGAKPLACDPAIRERVSSLLECNEQSLTKARIGQVYTREDVEVAKEKRR